MRLALSGEAGLLLLAWVLARWLGLAPLSQLRPSLESLVWGVGATVPLLAALAVIMRVRSGPLHQLVSLLVDRLGPLLGACSTGQLALLAIVAGISEEVLFRGVVQAGLTRVLPLGAALVGASVLFGLIHFATRTYALLAGLMGLYLGALFLIQQNLLAPIITHAGYDFAALVVVAQRARAGAAALGH